MATIGFAGRRGLRPSGNEGLAVLLMNSCAASVSPIGSIINTLTRSSLPCPLAATSRSDCGVELSGPQSSQGDPSNAAHSPTEPTEQSKPGTEMHAHPTHPSGPALLQRERQVLTAPLILGWGCSGRQKGGNTRASFGCSNP